MVATPRRQEDAMDLRPFYFNALENLGRMFESIGPSQYAEPTPCVEWDTRGLMNHILGGMWMFVRALGGEKMDGSSDRGVDLVANDGAAAFKAAQAASVEAWSEEDALERTVVITAGEMPSTVALRIALMESVVHGWDLAKATGGDHGINPMVAAAMLDGLRKTITDDQRGPGKYFGTEVKVSEDAPIEEQLVAFLGREP
jgi:uncharacterized protein (TIGR03086 family)